MLRIHQIQNAEAAKNYYEESLTKGDYYIDGIEEVGAWHGELAKSLGLEGTVSKEDFDKMIDNRNPLTGKRLTLRDYENRRPGYDFTFSCPKGVSVAMFLGGEEGIKIKNAFAQSVHETMKEMEKEVCTRVRIKGADHDRVSGNFAYASFTHTTSREVDVKEIVHAKTWGKDGLSKDQVDHLANSLGIDRNSFAENQNHVIAMPHLHMHCVVMNATRDPEEDRIKALTVKDLKKDAPYWQAKFHSRLASNLQDLGYGIQHTQNGFDLASITPDLSKKFSLRTQQIERVAHELGIRDPDRKAELGRETRRVKSKAMSLGELCGKWHKMLNTSEKNMMQNLKSHQHVRPEITPEHALNNAVEHCFERHSVVSHRRVLAKAIENGIGAFKPEAIEEKEHKELIHSGRLCTTQQVLKEEKDMLHLARSGKGKHSPINDQHKDFHHDFLNKDQKKAVNHVLKSADQVIALEGAPGVGKTTLLKEVKIGAKVAGKDIFAFAPSSRASKDVLAKDGFENANTVQHFILNEDVHKKIKNQIVLIDEAGMLSVPDMVKVISIAKDNDARLILAGDSKQHTSPERGDALRILQDSKVVKSYRLNQIMRQKGEYLNAVKSIDHGEYDKGLNRLDELGWIKESDRKEIYMDLANTYSQSEKPPLVIVPTHAEGDITTAAIRYQLKKQQRIKGNEVTFTSLQNLQMTKASKKDIGQYEKGHVVTFYKAVKGIKKGTSLLVDQITDKDVLLKDQNGKTHILPTKHADRFSVFKQKELNLAKGDAVRITANGKTLCGKRLNNGTTYQVKALKKKEIILNNGYRLSRDFGHLDYGYVTTSHSSQGASVDKVLVLMNENVKPAMNQAGTLVSLSRGKKQALIFTDDKEGLKEWAKRSSIRQSATEFINKNITERIKKEMIPAHPYDFEKNPRLRAMARRLKGRMSGVLRKIKGYGFSR